jgi:hypothetical protein
MPNPLTQVVEAKYITLKPLFDERARRIWAAVEARSLGRGGIIRVAEATGIARATIRAGLKQLDLPTSEDDEPLSGRRLRPPGGGRKPVTDHDPGLLRALEALVDPATRGDPISPLRWTCKSADNLAEGLQAQGHVVSERTVNRLLHDLGYSLQSNRKTIEGKGHSDRDAQFQYINRRAKAFQRQGQPVISVDTKKKELVGQYRNGGREWQPKGKPEKVKVHDFIDKDLGKAIPYGVYDMAANNGWVSVGVDHDTAEFAVETIRRWWNRMGIRVHPQAKKLLITADGGGSNGSRCRLWKVELQRLADEIGLSISVCHFPPGTSKWNKIEHRLFCHITQNWRGRPLVSHDLVVKLIGDTATDTGLRVKAALDTNRYDCGIKVTDEELAAVKITRHEFHGEWNYSIRPNTPNG